MKSSSNRSQSCKNYFQFLPHLVKLCAITLQTQIAQISYNCKGPSFKLLPFSQGQKLPQELRLRLGNHFFPNRIHKNSNFLSFPVKFSNGETSFSSQNYFSQAKIRYESKGVLFDQIKNWERRTESEN